MNELPDWLALVRRAKGAPRRSGAGQRVPRERPRKGVRGTKSPG